MYRLPYTPLVIYILWNPIRNNRFNSNGAVKQPSFFLKRVFDTLLCRYFIRNLSLPTSTDFFSEQLCEECVGLCSVYMYVCRGCRPPSPSLFWWKANQAFMFSGYGNVALGIDIVATTHILSKWMPSGEAIDLGGRAIRTLKLQDVGVSDWTWNMTI